MFCSRIGGAPLKSSGVFAVLSETDPAGRCCWLLPARDTIRDTIQQVRLLLPARVTIWLPLLLWTMPLSVPWSWWHFYFHLMYGFTMPFGNPALASISSIEGPGGP